LRGSNGALTLSTGSVLAFLFKKNSVLRADMQIFCPSAKDFSLVFISFFVLESSLWSVWGSS
jgi:hypothetical protein